MQKYFDDNRESWDQRTEVHRDSDFYDLQGFLQGKSSLQSIELAALRGKVEGKKLLHLQCHFGQDTLSWARMGAQATGCDFSPKAIKLARELNDKLKLDAHFVESNVYDLPQHLDDHFDLVFTSYGVIGWLPDLYKWANVINHFLKPGGLFYIVEFHPTLMLFDFQGQQLKYNYFNTGEPIVEEITGTYTDRDAPIAHREYYWSHALDEVFKSLLDEGLEVVEFNEYPFSPYNCFANMRPTGNGNYVFGNFPYSLPHVFSLMMRKPG